MEEKVILFPRISFLIISLSFLLKSVSYTTSSPTSSQPSIGTTIIADPNATSSPTPVGPLQDLPMINPLMNGETLSQFQHFDLRLQQTDRNHIFGYNDYQTNLVAWYTCIVPYVLGQDWLLHAIAQMGDHLVYNQKIIDVTLRLNDTKRPVVIAASAPAELISEDCNWWYGSVGNDQTLERWLDEALGTYSERFFL